jgi:LuxR family maltose regulon positive regulatory protein
LSCTDPELLGQPVIAAQAPAGYGKTSLVAQWRREHLAHGAVVAWVSAQEKDDPARLVKTLALSVRVASGRPTFGHTLLEGASVGGLEGITAWLAEVANSAIDLVLIVDEADRLPPGSTEALSYLLHNAPANLRAIVATRGDTELGLDDLVSYGHCTMVRAAELRFRLDETIALARGRFGTKLDADTVARLHELTEGWPLGLQLALSAIGRGGDLHTAVGALSTRAGELHDYFVGVLLSRLADDDRRFLERVAIVDLLHPQLAGAICGTDDAADRLARLTRETPIFVASEHGDWLRMHAVARDVLRARFESLPERERTAAHACASRWLADNGLLEDAARHALAAGERDHAYDLAERCLYDEITARGQQTAVLDWVARLPAVELDRRPRLLLAAAWALALSERHADAERLVERILAQAHGDAAIRCEGALVLSAAAVFADLPDRFAELFDPWSEAPPLTDPLLLYIHANRRALRALLDGDPARARHCQQQAPRGDFGGAFAYVARWGDFIIGLSYLWEGQVMLTENLLRPTLASAEADLGRRDSFVCMLASLLAAALWERDRPDEAAALLANRLDVLERCGLPETALLSYRTAARIAAAAGAEHRALELLEGMHAVGVARRLPRLQVASLADQVRVHARRFRSETCQALVARIDALLAGDALPTGPLWRRSVELLQHMAHAYAAIAAQRWKAALDPLAQAGALADRMAMARVKIEVMALRALALDKSGERAVGVLKESMDLAQTYGLARLFVDAHPALGDWARSVAAERAGGERRAEQAPAPPALAGSMSNPRERGSPGPKATASMALTPKEREVLELLARNLSNKEIALAMDVGEETIKWHLKNLFGKLAAGTRKQVVQRAQLLGLLVEA